MPPRVIFFRRYLELLGPGKHLNVMVPRDVVSDDGCNCIAGCLLGGTAVGTLIKVPRGLFGASKHNKARAGAYLLCLRGGRPVSQGRVFFTTRTG